MAETPPKKRDSIRETPEEKARAPHGTRPPKKVQQPIGTPAEKGSGASLNSLHKAPVLMSPVRDSAFDPFHAHPVKHTFIHYDTPKKTVTVSSPPRTVPSNFAPNRVVLLAQGPTPHTSSLVPGAPTQTLRLSDYLPSPVIHSNMQANSVQPQLQPQPQQAHAVGPMFPEFACNQMMGVQAAPVPAFPTVPPLPGPMSQCQAPMPMGGQMENICVVFPQGGQMLDMGAFQQQNPGAAPAPQLPMQQIGPFPGDQGCGQVCGVIIEEPITPQAQMMHSTGPAPGGMLPGPCGPMDGMAPGPGVQGQMSVLTAAPGCGGASIWQAPGSKWPRRGV